MTADVLLDVSWTIHSANNIQLPSTIESCLRNPDSEESQETLTDLGTGLTRSIQNATQSKLKDDFHDETAKTGQLRECKWSVIKQFNNSGRDQCLGLMIEIHHQKLTSRTALIPCGATVRSGTSQRTDVGSGKSPVLILNKSATSTFKQVLNFIDLTFDLDLSSQINPFHLPPDLLLGACSHFVQILTRDNNNDSNSSIPGNAALYQALLKQSISNLKLTITITAIEISPKLKNIDLDVPAETVGALLAKARDTQVSFLDELAKHIHLRTGLKLPLKPTTSMNGVFADTRDVDTPFHVSKIYCGAFAISTDGKIKLGSKPIDAAISLGLEEHQARQALQYILDSMLSQASGLSGVD